MDPLGSVLECIIVLVLILLNGLLSMLEMAVVSSRKSRLEQLAEEGSKSAAYIAKLADEPTVFLSTVQIGITLVGIGTGVYSGAMLAAPLEVLLRKIPFYAAFVSYATVVVLVTYLSLILGELLPKKLALNNPEKVSMSFARFIKTLITVFRPLTIFLSVSTTVLLRVIGVKPNEEPPVTEEEVRVLIEQGGVFDDREQMMIENVFALDDLRVSEIMTPRTKIEWLDLNDPADVQFSEMSEKMYSCFVVADGDLEHVAGVVYTKKVFASWLHGGERDLRKFIQQPLFVPEAMHTQSLLDMFKVKRIKVALVMDEFGGLAGMVTLRDVIEHLVGDLPSYDEDVKQEVVKREDGSWLVDGMLPISEFKDYFEFEELPLEEKNGYNTVAGFVVTNIGHIPEAGNYYEWEGYRFEVVDMDGTRVDKVLVTQLPQPEAEADDDDL